MHTSRSKRLAFLTLCDMALTPHYDYALPCLAAAGWDITVIGPNASQGVRLKTTPYKCQTVDLPLVGTTSRWAYEWAVMKKLMGLRFSGFDVVVLHSQAAGIRAAPLWAVPFKSHRFVYHSCDQYCPMDYPYRSRFEGSISRQSRLYLSTEYHRSYWSRDRYRLRCPIMTVPPNLSAKWPIAAPSEKVRRQLDGGDPDAFVLTLHGGYSPIRMVPQLLEALSLLPPTYRFALTSGIKPHAKLDHEVERLGLQGRVVKLAQLPFQEMLEFSVNADAGVLLYANTDFGNFFTSPGRLTEYVCSGTPLLASNHTGVENLVLRYNLGVTAEATSPKKLASAIVRLRDEIRSGVISRPRIRQAFLDHLAFDHWEPAVVKMFDELLEGPHKSVAAPPAFPWIDTA